MDSKTYNTINTVIKTSVKCTGRKYCCNYEGTLTNSQCYLFQKLQEAVSQDHSQLFIITQEKQEAYGR